MEEHFQITFSLTNPRLYIYLELEEEEEEEEDLDETATGATGPNSQANSTAGGGAKNDKHPKKLFKVSASTEGSCKITISAHTPPPGLNPAAATAGGGGVPTTNSAAFGKRKNKDKDFASPSSESKIQVHSGLYLPPSAGGGGGGGDGDGFEKCAVSIQFDPNTKKLWQELHYPYGNYTSFFR
jgi:hypothetical protein